MMETLFLVRTVNTVAVILISSHSVCESILSALYFYSVSTTDNYVKCPCNNFIKRHFNQYFVNNDNNNTVLSYLNFTRVFSYIFKNRFLATGIILVCIIDNIHSWLWFSNTGCGFLIVQAQVCYNFDRVVRLAGAQCRGRRGALL